jgi:Cdc6-like AAA superfamily ATPase
MSAASITWHDANQRYLMASVKLAKLTLELYHPAPDAGASEDPTRQIQLEQARHEVAAAAQQMPDTAALDTLVKVLGLSAFEKHILLLCAGVELDSSLATLIAGLHGGAALILPSFGLALAVLPEAHWSALSPNAPLRYWRLIEVLNEQLVSKSPLKIDEQILHYLTGVQHLDDRLSGLVEPALAGESLAPSHIELADRILYNYSQHFAPGGLPVIQLGGDNHADKEAIAAYVASRLGMYLYTIPVYAIPTAARDINELTRLWSREAALKACAIFLDYTTLDTTDKIRVQAVNSFIEHVQGIIIVSTGQAGPKTRRDKISYEITKPTSQEQIALWMAQLGEAAGQLNGQLDRIVAQFNLSARTISTAGAAALARLSEDGDQAQLLPLLWKTCCRHTRPHIDELAQRIEPVAGWEDIVLPAVQKDILKEIAMQVKQRNKVYQDWGFASRSSRGLGITVLFTGESGTGKTMAAEVLASELDLDLYRVDLSQVINKYVGETEKNLKQIFDAAEDGGAILLFDEADALFGKRSEVRDSHDRYANIEVSYLLQRMEAYRGLAILTTNMKSTMDKAWMRRIRFIVQFPFPDAAQRAEIWRRAFPANTPLAALQIDKLARLNIAGGNIRNIAMNAAFIAADEGRPVDMSHISRAARSEYNKLEKPLINAELGTW